MDKDFTAEDLSEVREILKRYPDTRSALLPVLYIAQRRFGYVSEEAMKATARVLGLSPLDVYETATFYTLYNLQPVGRYRIDFCRTLSCWIMGGGVLLDHLEKRLGIRVGETTPDGLFTLRTVECLASCGSGPMMQINDVYYENLTCEKIDKILKRLRQGKEDRPARGEAPGVWE